MIRPARAPVRPRVYAPDCEDALPLEDVFLSRLEKPWGTIALTGGRGSGKSTALAHLAAVLSEDGRFVFMDEPDARGVCEAGGSRLVVFASLGGASQMADQHFQMAPWGEDERIEYLLAVHAEKCASVIGRLRASVEGPDLAGNPELWRIVLDQMALDEAVVDARGALRRGLAELFSDHCVAEDARRFCLACLTDGESQQQTYFRRLGQSGCQERLLRLLGYPSVRLLLAAEEVVRQLQRGEAEEVLGCHRPREFVWEIARHVASTGPAARYLQALVTTERADCQAMTTSILHAARLPWTPLRKPRLSGAYLSGVSWSGQDLRQADLRKADLSEANLELAVLDRANVSGACLRGAVLRRACLDHLVGERVDMSGADLSGAAAGLARLAGGDFRSANLDRAVLTEADLRGANFTRARLSGANLEKAAVQRAVLDGANLSDAILREASLIGASFREAILHGAHFQMARLTQCNLEYLEVGEAHFEYATLDGARLTGCRMPGAKFNGAKLRQAGLADIDWEGADLRGADFREASFHLGSSRSGLVDSPLASEGTRTGFYTDEFDQQYYKSPEEIRKANLRGADLRGAKVDGADFYLVDLREAKYTDHQLRHFRRCRAILDDRA